MSSHYRFLKAAANDYTPTVPATACDGRLHTALAELALREQLRAGQGPDVVLVGPESAQPMRCEAGAVADVFAFTERPLSPEHVQLVTGFRAGGMAVIARLEGEAMPDPVSPEWAAAGSVLIRSGRITALFVAAWLEPAAEQLEDRYGVPVHVCPSDFPDVDPQPAPPLVVDQVLDVETCELLCLWVDENEDGPVREGRYGPVVSAKPPPVPALQERLLEVAREAGVSLGLPVTEALVFLLRYDPGSWQPEHVDWVCSEWDAHSRTVSLSVLLNEPDSEYYGGTFRTAHGDVAAHRGDAIAFTARTPHEVLEVTQGRRYALVAFGSTPGWGAGRRCPGASVRGRCA